MLAEHQKNLKITSRSRLIYEFFESMKGPINIINSDKTLGFDQSERAQGPIYIINSYPIHDIQYRSHKSS